MGAGLGSFLQQPNVAVQTVLPKEQATIGIALLAFVQSFGGTVFVTVCQDLLENKLIAGLAGRISSFDPATITGQGATSIRHVVRADQLPFVLELCNDSLRFIWYVGLGLSCLTFVASLGFEWKSVKEKNSQEGSEASDGRQPYVSGALSNL